MAAKPSGARGRPYTEADDDMLSAEYANCDSLAGLAARMGRTLRALYARASELGLSRPIRSAPGCALADEMLWAASPPDYDAGDAYDRRVA